MNSTINKIRINNIQVKPIKGAYDDPRPVYGAELFPDNYCDIGGIALQGSGKTTTAREILLRCAMPSTKRRMGTIVIFFVGQIYSDPTYKRILADLNRRNIPFIVNNSLYEEVQTTRGAIKSIDSLREIVKYLKELNKDDYDDFTYRGGIAEDSRDEESAEEEPADESAPLIGTRTMDRAQALEKAVGGRAREAEDEYYEELVIRRADPKSKYQYPEIIFVVDDLSEEMKATSLTALLKEERHIRSKCLFFSQDWKDFPRSGRSQFNYILLFPDLAEDRVYAAYKDLGLRVPWSKFYAHYLDATARIPDKNGNLKKSHSFLWVDVRRSVLRKNFDTEYSDNVETHELAIELSSGAGKQFNRSRIQSILFDPSEWTQDEAIDWLLEHGFIAKKIDDTGTRLRFRQRDPRDFARMRTTPLRYGVQFIIGY